MAISGKPLLLIAAALLGAPAFAQQGPNQLETAVERDMSAAEAEQRSAEVQLREAEEQLAAAARRIAELSTRRLPTVVDIERYLGNRVMLGITIGRDDDDDPVEGVTVRGVTPGGAAAEAGLRSGDVITAINGESLTAENDEQANAKLLDFMSGVEDGDLLDVEFLRDGRHETVEVRAAEMPPLALAFRGGRGGHLSMPAAPHVPRFRFWFSDGSGWGDMELAALTERLGRYFGTDEGLLVVRAPDDESLKLEDGDVIQSIDGREPKSVSHAMRILGSYQSGEQLELEIMRDKRRQTLKIEMPDNRSSSAWWPRTAPYMKSGVMTPPKPGGADCT